ncbi:MAG: type II toxin-antitoxin system RelE/ParE family toxin [Patescibacteria group bacterium]
MQRIEKVLRKLSREERLKVERGIEKILNRDFVGLNVRKIRGKEDVYRVRIGRVRIIFFWKDTQTDILIVDRRNDNTYNF